MSKRHVYMKRNKSIIINNNSKDIADADDDDNNNNDDDDDDDDEVTCNAPIPFVLNNLRCGVCYPEYVIPSSLSSSSSSPTDQHTKKMNETYNAH